MRKRRRVTGNPVALTTRLRISSVPNVELLAGSEVKSRTRFGADVLPTVPSRFRTGMSALRCMGLDKFSGPAAPRRCPAPTSVPLGLIK
jgi:hypothetical protein